jgi:hypothetical protein
MRKLWLVGFLLLVLLFVSGCGTTVPSAPSGVSLEVRVLSKTGYTARIEMTLANRSSASFYVTRVEVTGEVCERGGTCAVYSFAMAVPYSEPLPPGAVRSAQETVSIADFWTYMRWFEIVMEGRLGGRSIQISSNRVYF